MYPRVVAIKHLGEYRLDLTFTDGTRAELDFSPMVNWGGRFGTLRDIDEFKQVRLDAEAETLVWPGNIDICPDVLYHLATGVALPGELPRRAATVIRIGRMSDRVGA